MWAKLSVLRLRRAGHPIPEAAPSGGGDQRVLIGPANSAGQGFAWARALERARNKTAATSMQFVQDNDPYAFAVDQAVLSGFGAYSTRWQRAQLAALASYRAVIVESAMAPLGGLFKGDASTQIAALRGEGVSVALLFHGSDLRDPDRHLADEPLSYFSVDASFADEMRARTTRSRALVEHTRAPVFVSTPDLLSEIPDASWLPVVVDVEAWSRGTTAPLSGNSKPVVVHVPSSSSIKGTSLIDPILRRLHAEGVIQYRSVSGVPHAEVRELVRLSDIVVDQVRGGPYGVAACEAMAAGRIVVSHVAETVRERVVTLSGHTLPVVEAVPDTLEEVLRNVLAHPQRAQGIAERGTDFVRHWHDGRVSGSVLADWLDRSELGLNNLGNTEERHG